MDNDKTRKTGYYWVQISNVWIVAQWGLVNSGNDKMWYMPGTNVKRTSDVFDEIDENRIERNE